MTFRGLMRLSLLDLRADARGTLLDVLATCFGAATLVFFVALGLGVDGATRTIFPGDARVLEAIPPAVSLGEILGGGRLDDEALRRFRALPGVAGAWPKMNLRVPMTASSAPEGLPVHWPSSLAVQIPAVGVSREMIVDEIGQGTPFDDPGPDGAIPVVISRKLPEIFNRTIAPSWNVRKLPPAPALVGIQLPIRVGRSIVAFRTESRVTDARLVLAGFSDRVPIYAAALPIETVRRLHTEYGKPDQGYSGIVLLADRPDDVPAIAAAVRRMGFSLEEGDRSTAERVGTAVALTTGILAFLALLMCALAALAIAQSLFASVRARARDIALLEAVGANPTDVRTLVMTEAALTGLGGGIAGVLLARLAAAGADVLLVRALPDFPFKPDTFFAFPVWVFALGVGVAVGASALGALAPAAAASRIDPARSLS